MPFFFPLAWARTSNSCVADEENLRKAKAETMCVPHSARCPVKVDLPTSHLLGWRSTNWAIDSLALVSANLLSKVCAKVLSRLWSCSGQVSVSRIPIETRRTTKDDEEKKTSKRVSRVPLRDLRGKKFQGFLSGTSGEKKKKKLRRAHTMRKTHSMFYLQCSVASVLPRGMGLSPGFYLYIFFFFCSLEREPSLWENTWSWEILRILENFPGIWLGNQDLWGGERESTFDTGRRVETPLRR